MISIETVKEKLSSIKYPGFSKSIIDFGFVKDLKIHNNEVIISVEITSTAPEVEKTLKSDIQKAFKSSDINIQLIIKKPIPPKENSNTISGKNIAPNISHFVMVSSGKGGVGKSTTSVNLAIALAMQGKKVGILDADIYGPNIPRMMGLENQEPKIIGQKIAPFDIYGVKVMSMGFMIKEGQAIIWRGAMIMKAIEQLLKDVLWGDLDVLVIDMPPGTGDAQLTLAQSVPVTVGVNVTTPQQVALDDSRRSLEMFNKLNIPIAGIVENMSGFICPKCDEESDIFGTGTCQEIAKQYNTDVIGTIPIESSIRVSGDEGKPVVYHYPQSVTGKKYMIASTKLWYAIKQSNTENASIQPNMPAGVSACSPEGQAHSAKQNN